MAKSTGNPLRDQELRIEDGNGPHRDALATKVQAGALPSGLALAREDFIATDGGVWIWKHPVIQT